MPIIRLSDGSEMAMRLVRAKDQEPASGSSEGGDVVLEESAASPQPEDEEHDQP